MKRLKKLFKKPEEGYLRLKDLKYISGDVPKYAPMMEEIFGYKNYRLFRKRRFKKYFLKVHKLILSLDIEDIKTIPLQEDCPIKKPSSIDNISFMAMMELQSLRKKGEEYHIVDLITETITKACFSENYDEDYDSDSNSYKEFREKVSSCPIKQMMGLYNWISDQLDISERSWHQRFMSVEVTDKYFEQAGGHRMNQFNIISTLKSICRDFNVDYDKAWQMSYAITQTNSYASATYAHIHDEMRKLKEIEFERSRKNPH